jgi:crotonobetainyl-CoA:carnitine CoA-transferase CaiB-like acyl-CoA transferase
VALADEVTGLFGAMAVLIALRHRDRTGQGQVIDLSLIESLFSILGPLPTVYDQLGEVAERMGSRIAYAAPRGTYRTSDGEWLAISGTAPSVAVRVFKAIGRVDLLADARFDTPSARVANVEALDRIISDWSSQRTLEECMAALLAADAAACPVYDMARLFGDPHVQARGMIARIDDGDLGCLAMQNVVPRMSLTPGAIRHAGRPVGADTESVWRDWNVTVGEFDG